ncbi:DUF3040 domain-containing protein [Streptomyces sp. NPDC048255]|uniref:DUF3040 domain-containing protein n=1 Tax=Streptomyces sp. NPDC048255 TaxID=3154713 RepID=UPI0033CBE695
MDDRRILAEIERGLAEEDSGLAALMDALNQQFADGPAKDRDPPDSRRRRDWRVVAGIIFLVVSVLGLFLTAALQGTSQSADVDDRRPPGRAAAVLFDPGR